MLNLNDERNIVALKILIISSNKPNVLPFFFKEFTVVNYSNWISLIIKKSDWLIWAPTLLKSCLIPLLPKKKQAVILADKHTQPECDILGMFLSYLFLCLASMLFCFALLMCPTSQWCRIVRHVCLGRW